MIVKLSVICLQSKTAAKKGKKPKASLVVGKDTDHDINDGAAVYDEFDDYL